MKLPALRFSTILLWYAIGWAMLSPCTAEEHVYQSSDGSRIRGEVIAINGAIATIKATENGQLIELSIADLRDEDKDFLIEWLEAEQLDSARDEGIPDGWARLTIEVPMGFDMVSSASLTRALEKVAGRTHRGIIPIGSWISVAMSRHPDRVSIRGMFLRYNGERFWRLRLDDRAVLLSTDVNEEPRIVAVAVPESECEAFLDGLRDRNLAERVSFRVESAEALRAVSNFGHPVAGLMLDNRGFYDTGVGRAYIDEEKRYLSLEEENPLLGLDPQAVFLEGGDEILKVAASLPSLEHATLSEPKEAQWSFKAFQKLRELPKLKSLFLINREYPEADFMAGFDRLQSLKITGGGSVRSFGHVRDPLSFPPLASLESLSVNMPITFESNSLKNLPRLKYVRGKGLEASSAVPDDVFYVDYTGKDKNYKIAIEEGRFPLLRHVEADYEVDFSHMPHVEKVHIGGLRIDADRFRNANNLHWIGISDICQDGLESIANMANLKNLEAITISAGKLTDLSPLARLPNLKRISVSSLSESPGEIDLSPFSALEDFTAYNLHQTRRVSGIASHPRLTQIHLWTMSGLEDLGETADNHVLHAITLQNLDALADLSPLQKTTGVKGLRISLCPKLTEPLLLDETNELVYLNVSKNEGLDHRPRRDEEPPPAP